VMSITESFPNYGRLNSAGAGYFSELPRGD
jgi:hypothetical protein